MYLLLHSRAGIGTLDALKRVKDEHVNESDDVISYITEHMTPAPPSFSNNVSHLMAATGSHDTSVLHNLTSGGSHLVENLGFNNITGS